ncbi:hypothetical protein [Azospirillum largimobile]
MFFQDEARFGQKGRLCHRWWLKGQRPAGVSGIPCLAGLS